MHSGNVGHAQNLDTLVRASTFLRDLKEVLVVIVGFGVRYADMLRLAHRLDVQRVRFLPYQPREALPLSLSAAGLHFVGLAEGLAGFVVPSRLYGIMAAGRPVVVAADPESETAQVVERVGCGIVIPPSRPELLAEVIRDAYEGRYDLDGMGARGRAYVTEDADTRVAVGRYREVLRELVEA
jgi:glycosyltransferase involved in cell wall biosynthesis